MQLIIQPESYVVLKNIQVLVQTGGLTNRFKHLSLAQVIKRAISNQRLSSPNKVNKLIKCLLPLTKKEIHVTTGQNSNKAQHKKVFNTPTNKVSADVGIPCKNRFQVLSVNTIVEPSSDTKTCNANNTHVNRWAITKASVKNQQHASINDADAKLLKVVSHEFHDTESLSKYDIPIRVKNKVQNYKSALPHSATLRL